MSDPASVGSVSTGVFQILSPGKTGHPDISGDAAVAAEQKT